MLGDDVFQSIKNLFETSTLLPGYCYTGIVLIPKIPNSISTTHFRPINRCNFKYKIISKILANRLKSILPNLITFFQSVFVSGRFIHDNTFIAHEIFHHLKTNKAGGREECAMKLDMNKAYYRVEWTFLIKTLKKLGVLRTWCKWIDECITNVQ